MPRYSDRHKPCAGGGTGACNIAAVLRDLRFDQNDVQHTDTPLKNASFPIVCQSFPKINLKNTFFSTFFMQYKRKKHCSRKK